MRKYSLLFAALCMIAAGCGGGAGHTTPVALAHLPTAGSSKLHIVIPKSATHVAFAAKIHSPIRGHHKLGVYKMAPGAKLNTVAANRRKPAFIDPVGTAVLRITSEALDQNGVVIASNSAQSPQLGGSTSIDMSIPVYAGSGVIIVREVDTASGIALASGEQTYTLTPGVAPAALDIALSLVPGGLSISSTDVPTAQFVPAGSSFLTTNVSAFCGAGDDSETFTALPADGLGTLSSGDGALPSVSIVAGSTMSDNGGQSSISPTGIPNQFTLNYDDSGNGVQATFKSVDAFNNVAITTMDLTDTCNTPPPPSPQLSIVSTDGNPEFHTNDNTIEFDGPGDSAAFFTPVEPQGATPEVLVFDGDSGCAGIINFDRVSDFNIEGQTYGNIGISPIGAGSCVLTFTDGISPSVFLNVTVESGDSSPTSEPSG